MEPMGIWRNAGRLDENVLTVADSFQTYNCSVNSAFGAILVSIHI